MTTTYTCEFVGRPVSAVGISYHVITAVTAEHDATWEEIHLKLYDDYEHIQQLMINSRTESEWNRTQHENKQTI